MLNEQRIKTATNALRDLSERIDALTREIVNTNALLADVYRETGTGNVATMASTYTYEASTALLRTAELVEARTKKKSQHRTPVITMLI
jgi:hypothetical protein